MSEALKELQRLLDKTRTPEARAMTRDFLRRLDQRRIEEGKRILKEMEGL